MVWKPMKTAPRDGTPILVRRKNDNHFEYTVVRWIGSDPTYPWISMDAAHPEWRLDEWHELPK